MENFLMTYNVSRETYDRLELCRQALSEWQNKFNLVSRKSLEDAWNRHFLDSAQLYPLLPRGARTLADLGSGAGFPGMVLAIMATEKTPYLKVTLIERTGKKTLYLNHLKKITGCTNVEILNKRIEDVEGRSFEVITARADTALSDLLAYAFPLLKKNGICIFPKGRSYKDEIKAAENKWNFQYDAVSSATDSESVVLVIRNLTRKGRS